MRERKGGEIPMELNVYVNASESVSAAVQNGADAVTCEIRAASQPGISAQEFLGAAEFCRVRGVKIYAEIDFCASDATLADLVAAARMAWLNGADAIYAADPGLFLALRRALPEAPLFVGRNMNLHNPDGVKIAAAMGAKRVSLTPQLDRANLKAITETAPIETELVVHGVNMPAYPGQNHLAAVVGTGSESRGRCGRDYLTHYKLGARGALPFVIRDSCLISHLAELEDMKLTAVALDGTDRRPEYVAYLTGLYRRTVSLGKLPGENELALLDSISPSAGLSDTSFIGKREIAPGEIFGEPPEESSPFLSAIRKSYIRREFQRVPVRFAADIALGAPLKIAAEDDRGNIAVAEGGKSELAFHREFAQTALQTELYKTGGTPFLTESVKCRIAKGISVPVEEVAPLRDKLLNELMEKRKALPPRSSGEYTEPEKRPNSAEPPVLTVSVLKASQLSERILELAPPVIYLPLEEIHTNEKLLAPFLAVKDISVCAVLPTVIYESEKSEIAGMLIAARQLGVEEVLAGNLGHAVFARQMGFRVRGGLGLNVLSSASLYALKAFGLVSATLSPELSGAEVAAISKHIPTELMVYGRMPVMLSDGCLVKGATGACSCESFSGIADTSGLQMPVLKAYHCRNTVWSSKKLYLARRSREYMNAGLWGVRLQFTTENAEECAAVTERFLGLGNYVPASFTQGSF